VSQIDEPTLEQEIARARAVAAAAGMPFARLVPEAPEDERLDPNPLAVHLLPAQVCQHFTMVPVAYRDGIVTVAVGDPDATLAHDVAKTMTGRPLRFVHALPAEIERVVEEHLADLAAPSFEGMTPAPDEAAAETTVQIAQPPLPGGRLGDLVVARGLATEEEVADALVEKGRTGSRLGAILASRGVLTAEEVVSLVAEQHDVGVVDLEGVELQPEVAALLPEEVVRRRRLVPLVVEGDVLYVAAPHIEDATTVDALRELSGHDVRLLLAERSQIDALIQRTYEQEYLYRAVDQLADQDPEDCANRVVTGPQRLFLLVAAVVIVAALIAFTTPAAIALVALTSAFYVVASLYKFRLTYRSLGHQYEIVLSDEEVDAIDDADLPVFTILVPLYKELAVLPRLMGGIEGLDYPKTKLDVRLLCEEDDEETVQGIRDMHLPPHYRLVVVPDAQPKTKPKACNFGLIQAEGKYVVIYDAEDRPDPKQLKKVVLAFERSDENVVCIQGKLNYYNARHNLLTRWFTIEYSMWFDLLLPGLDAVKAPIPLGGTSNTFVTEKLLELGAWDPYNVTEDADLGIRLHKAGYRTAMVDSTTLEEANSEVGNWLRQRSRWIKGYIQTYLVHMRNPLKLLRDLGPKNFFSFQMMIGGTFIFLLNPIFWLLTTVFFFTQAGFIQAMFPSFVFYAAAFLLFFGNFIFVYLNVAGSLQRGYYDLCKYALLSPLYWGLMSIAAWKGFLQLFTNPFYWEKTEHGLTGVHHEPGVPPRPTPPSTSTAARPATGEPPVAGARAGTA